jgi:uncharacterized protein
MSSRKQLRHGLLVAAMALGGLALPPARAAADDSVASTEPVIVAQGSGQVSVRPDSIHIDLSAEAQADTIDAATSQVNAAMTSVLAAIQALALPDLTIATQSVSFSPVYGAQNNDSTQTITGFDASNHILVTALNVPDEDLAKRAAQIVDAAIHAGANRLGGVDFYLADPSQAEDQALTLAVQNAERDAQTMARAAGVTLTGPVSIEEATASRVPLAYGIQAGANSTPIQVGDLDVDATVTVKYAFQ